LKCRTASVTSLSSYGHIAIGVQLHAFRIVNELKLLRESQLNTSMGNLLGVNTKGLINDIFNANTIIFLYTIPMNINSILQLFLFFFYSYFLV